MTEKEELEWMFLDAKINNRFPLSVRQYERWKELKKIKESTPDITTGV